MKQMLSEDLAKKIPPQVFDIFDKFIKAGYEIYLVGGGVRDLLLERTIHDCDFTTNATPEEIQEILPDSFYDNTFGTVGLIVGKPAYAKASAGEKTSEDKNALRSFLEEAALMSNHDEVETNKDLVNLMTLHCAKGLEFPTVFIAGMEDGIFPHSRSLIDAWQMEEERRLCYVGITRAKEKLYLIAARLRNLFGSTIVNPPSRFLNDIPPHLVEYINFNDNETDEEGIEMPF